MTSEAKQRARAAAQNRLNDQRKWIDSHGQSLAGYVLRYGDSDAPVAERQGDGGQKIYAADMAELHKLEAAVVALRPTVD